MKLLIGYALDKPERRSVDLGLLRRFEMRLLADGEFGKSKVEELIGEMGSSMGPRASSWRR